MKPFSKSEILSLVIIFAVLISVSVPNFIVSFRRARDQVRRDDMGALVHSLDAYLSDFGSLPPSSPDGRIMDCLKPGDTPVQNKLGRWIINFIPCDWGKEAMVNLITGKVYMPILPREPNFKKGDKYLYFSDGNRYQLYAAMEGVDEAEIDPKIIARNLSCGLRICNIGRSYNVPTDISIEAYDRLLNLTK